MFGWRHWDLRVSELLPWDRKTPELLGVKLLGIDYELKNKMARPWSWSVVPGLVLGYRHFLSSIVGEGNGTPLQYSCLENPMDGGAWWAAVHGVAKSQTQLSNFTFSFHFHTLEKEMATHSSVLAWRIPGTGEPSGLLSMGWHRAGHDWSDLAAAAAAAAPLYQQAQQD